jgi:hypothetical protein
VEKRSERCHADVREYDPTTLVLHALKERYQLRDPYTYSGIVLVSVNRVNGSMKIPYLISLYHVIVQVALNPFTPLNICE